MLQEIACIFCDSKNNGVAIEENGYVGQRCVSCNLIYISPRPPQREIEKIYACGDACIEPQQHLSRARLKRLQGRHALRILKRIARSGSLLEIGSGAGYFLDEARRAGFEPFAIEPNPVQAEFIEHRLGIPCERRPLSFETFQNKQFDIIYHADVVSHFYDPIDSFRTIHRKLRSGGLVIFETGNFADVRPEYLQRIPTFQYPDHLFFFGRKALEKLLETTGFEMLKIYSYSILGELSLARLAKRYSGGNGRNGKADSAKRGRSLKGIVRPAYYELVHFMRYQVGAWMPKSGRPQTLIVVARKGGEHVPTNSAS